MPDSPDPNATITHSRSVENFLKAIYGLQQAGERVATNALAETLRMMAPSVTDMARRLEAAGLIDYQKYRGVRLTDAGEEIALKVVRRHRLIELYLVEELGYALHEVHDEAEELEHVVSDRFIAAIAGKLGNPTFDPHGDPIPGEDGSIQPRALRPLAELLTGSPAVIARFKSDDPAMLQHIEARGFRLNAPVQVLERDPFDGPLTVLLEDDQRAVIGSQVAQCILVTDGD